MTTWKIKTENPLKSNLCFQQYYTVNTIVCEKDAPLQITCGMEAQIRIQSASYGRSLPDSQMCPFGRSHNDDTTCHHPESLTKVKDKCEGLRECEISNFNTYFGDPCGGTYKYLEVDYFCDGPTTTIETTTSTAARLGISTFCLRHQV